VTNWLEVRKLFPALERFVYLSTASGGPMSRQAVAAARRYYDEELEVGDTLWDDWLARVEDTRRAVAGVLNAEPSEIALLTNASQGLNHAARLLGPTGEVVAARDEFPSVTLPWLLGEYPVTWVEHAPDGVVSLESIERAMSPGTRFVATSHVNYRTGFRQDLRALGAICRARGLRLVVDATQSFSAFPIDVRADDVDVLVSSCYKWPAAGYGIAVVFVKREILESARLPAAGWRSARVPLELLSERLDLATEARALELGHPPFAGAFALGAALGLVQEIGIDRIAARIQDLTDCLHATLDRLGVPIVSPRPREQRAGITLIALPDHRKVVERLRERGVLAAARGDYIRLAVHYYNSEADIDRFGEALRAVLS